MINEVLPGCDLDCRNFLAIPSKIGKPSLEELDQFNMKDKNIFSASYGPQLLEI